MEKRGRNGCASNFQDFWDGCPIYLQEKLWRVCTKNLENGFGGTFAEMEAMLPLHNKNQGWSANMDEGSIYVSSK
jgi:hypothetical protein